MKEFIEDNSLLMDHILLNMHEDMGSLRTFKYTKDEIFSACFASTRKYRNIKINDSTWGTQNLKKTNKAILDRNAPTLREIEINGGNIDNIEHLNRIFNYFENLRNIEKAIFFVHLPNFQRLH